MTDKVWMDTKQSLLKASQNINQGQELGMLRPLAENHQGITPHQIEREGQGNQIWVIGQSNGVGIDNSSRVIGDAIPRAPIKPTHSGTTAQAVTGQLVAEVRVVAAGNFQAGIGTELCKGVTALRGEGMTGMNGQPQRPAPEPDNGEI